MQEDIHKLNKRIQRNLVVYFVIIFILFVLTFFILSEKISIAQATMSKTQIVSSADIYKTRFSERYSIVASSDIFMEFLHSGSEMRKQLLPDFLFNLTFLKSSFVKGMAIKDFNNNTLFENGSKTSTYLILKICYFNSHLDCALGEDRYKWMLYVDSEEYAQNFLKAYPNMKPCSNCEAVNLLQGSKFGVFDLMNHAILEQKISLSTTATENVRTYFLLISIIFLIFYFLMKLHLKNIFSRYILLPLQQLTHKIKYDDVNSEDQYPLKELQYMSEQVVLWQSRQKIAESQKHEAQIGKIAARTAHDIQSPLAVMQMILYDLKSDNLERNKTLLISAIQSIRDTANNLLAKYRSPELKPNTKINEDDASLARYILLPNYIEQLVAEKKQEWRASPCDLNVVIDKNSKELWQFLAPNELKRMLSNLLNNAYEALMQARAITLKLEIENHQAVLYIIDTGKGIAPSDLSAVLSGKSLKHSGNGLGLSGALEFMRLLGGDIELKSVVNQGTEVKLIFPVIAEPTWFPHRIELAAETYIVIVDDDLGIHNFLRSHLQGLSLNTMHFLKIEDAKTWLVKNPEEAGKALFLIDYDYEDAEENGLDFLNFLSVKRRGILVTSRAEEIFLQQEIISLQSYLVPKILLQIFLNAIHVIRT